MTDRKSLAADYANRKPAKITIIAIDRKTGEEIDISDNLYFFEENFIRSIGDDFMSSYDFRFVFEGSTREEFETFDGVLYDWIGT